MLISLWALVQPALIFALVFLEAIAQLAALGRIIHDRLYRHYAAFSGLTLVMWTRAVFSLASRGHLHPYLEFWKATQWPLALLGAAAAMEAFWRLALHFRNVRGFGWILLATLAGVASLAAWIVTAMNAKWDTPLRGAVVFEECVEVALMIVATLSLVFFRAISSIPVRPNALHHLTILACLFGSSFAGSFIALVTAARGMFAANVTITAGLAGCYFWWAVAIRKSGDTLPFAMPPLASAAEIEALNAWDHRLYAEGRGVIEESKKPS